ncbi:hypothetical protein SAMN05518670_3613 [Paenibacillus sp. OK076]|nr:hypothetical protein SAMN05518670_3613 [Paenibacillus sp. OK076]
MLYIFITWLILILMLILLAQGIQKNSKDREGSVKRWRGWLIGLFILGSVPLGYALYTELRGGYIGANIGLGLALFFTWAYCALLLCVTLVIWGRYGYKQYRKK